MERPKHTVLDIGINIGGKYIRKDPSGIRRIGMDLRGEQVRRCRDKYGIPVFVADADIGKSLSGEEKRLRLPLSSSSVSGIDIIFPHNSLLFALARSQRSLWEEMEEILKPHGSVKIVFDVPPEDYRAIKLTREGPTIRIEKPQQLIWQAAVDNGFVASTRKLNDNEVRWYGTEFSNIITRRMRKDPNYKAYELIATKISQPKL